MIDLARFRFQNMIVAVQNSGENILVEATAYLTDEAPESYSKHATSKGHLKKGRTATVVGLSSNTNGVFCKLKLSDGSIIDVLPHKLKVLAQLKDKNVINKRVEAQT